MSRNLQDDRQRDLCEPLKTGISSGRDSPPYLWSAPRKNYKTYSSTAGHTEKAQTLSAETIDYLTQDEMRRWLSVISYPRDYAIFLLAYRYGRRASAIGLISVDAIDLNQQRIRLQRLQGSLTSTQPLKPDEIKAIKRALQARSIEPVRERFP